MGRNFSGDWNRPSLASHPSPLCTGVFDASDAARLQQSAQMDTGCARRIVRVRRDQATAQPLIESRLRLAVKHAVPIAEGGRTGEVRLVDEVENSPAAIERTIEKRGKLTAPLLQGRAENPISRSLACPR